MAKSLKKKHAGVPAKVAAKGKSKPKKRSMATGSKKSVQKKTSKAAAVLETPTKPSQKATFSKLTKKSKKLATVQTTPSTASSKSTTGSKRALTLMSGLSLKSLSSSKKSKGDDAEAASVADAVTDYTDPATIVWLTREGVTAALEHHFPGDEQCLDLDYDDQVMKLLTKFRLSDLRYVLQGLLTDAGKNWRKLKLNKLKSMKALAPEFVNTCVDLLNAKTELDASSSVPGNITIDHKDQKKVTL